MLGINSIAAGTNTAWKLRNCALRGLLAAWLALVATDNALALVEIDLDKANTEPLPIAITEFTGAEVASDVVSVVTADLRNSGLFRPLEPASFIDNGRGPDAIPRFSDWQVINAQALVMGRVTQTADGRLQAEFRLWDVYAGEQLVGQQFVTSQQNWRRVAHIIADAIYEKLTGEKGYFNTRIVYIDESGSKSDRVKRLAIMDQDGANAKTLTSGASLVLTPRFSPTRQEITYMSYEDGIPHVYLLQIETGQRELVSDSQRMSFSPRFSPDGQKIIMSLELDEGGNSNIFTMDLRSRSFTRLTNTAAIDTAPSYSPDGQRIVFESDRGGRQQLYVMNADGSNQQRISFGPGAYATPVWSPRGDTIAFTKFYQGNCAIGVMNPDGSGERILTESFHNEGPTWAPNGRVLMFFRDAKGSGGPKLFSIDLTGYNERQLTTQNFASDPAWSPLLD